MYTSLEKVCLYFYEILNCLFLVKTILRIKTFYYHPWIVIIYIHIQGVPIKVSYTKDDWNPLITLRYRIGYFHESFK